MTVIVEEDPLLLGIPAQGRAELLDFIHSGIEALFVPSLWWKKKGDTCHVQGAAAGLAHVATSFCIKKYEESMIMRYVFTRSNYNIGHELKIACHMLIQVKHRRDSSENQKGLL